VLSPAHCVGAVADVGAGPLGFARVARRHGRRPHAETVLELKLVLEGKVESLAPLSLGDDRSADQAEQIADQVDRLEGICSKGGVSVCVASIRG
jgi:hypothetical protein